MLTWRPSHEEDVFLEAQWPGEAQWPSRSRGFFEVNPQYVGEVSPVASGLYTAWYVERPAAPEDDPVFHAVGSGLDLVEALLACRRYVDTNGRDWRPS